MSMDTTVNVANQQLQGGADWEIGGKLNFDTVNGSPQLGINDVILPMSVVFTIAAGSANQVTVSLQLVDGTGTAIAFPTCFEWWLCDLATGVGLTATTASGTVATLTNGTDFQNMVAKKAFYSQTTGAGVYKLAITDTGKTGFFVAVQLPLGNVVVSRQLLTADYG